VNITDIPRLCINVTEIDRVTTFKLLGVFISSDLSWDSHVTYILQKAAKRMYCINYLVRSGVPTCDMFMFIVQSSVLFLNIHVQSGILVLPKNYLKILSVLKSVV